MRSTAPLFGVVDKLSALLPPETGFEPYSFVAFAYGTDEDGRDNLRRSFRYELDGCCTHLTVEAPVRSPWRQRIVDGLAQAGYEPWLAGDDSVDVRRWLSTAAERRRELRFLEDLGTNGGVERWPRRGLTTRPARVSQGRWSRAQWARVVDEVREARVAWDDVGLCFSRSGERAAPTRRGRVNFTVGLLPYWWDSKGSGKRILVFAHVVDTTDTLPPRVARAFRRVLREAGFEPDGARSVHDGKRLHGRVGFDRRLTNERGAVHTCLRIYDALLDVPLP